VAPFEMARFVPSGGIRRGTAGAHLIYHPELRQPCGGMPGPGRSSSLSCSSERRI
jgi:hypothetical protein